MLQTQECCKDDSGSNIVLLRTPRCDYARASAARRASHHADERDRNDKESQQETIVLRYAASYTTHERCDRRDTAAAASPRG